jgi:enoyl-CoA hydratase/carnithine racemase
MATEMLKLKVKEGLAILTLANPDKNRLNRAVLEALRAALARISQADVRAIFLKGEGPAFSFGADVKELFVDASRHDLARLLVEYLDFIGAVEALPKPTIAAVHGVCSSGGLELALAFDHLWAAAGTKIGFMETTLAIPPLAGGIQRIAARAGSARAMEIASAGRMYDVESFERWNIVNRIVAAESLHTEAEAFALKLSAGPTRAFAAVKSLLRAYEQTGVPETDKITVATVMPLMDSDDAVAAVTALISAGPKRGAVTFTGT